MSEFIVYSVPGSPFGRAVLATLQEKGQSHRFSPLAGGALKTEPHLSRHPFGRVPVLEHNGYSLYETQAILRYLDRVLPSPSLTPADPQTAGRMDQVMNVCDWYLFQGINTVIGFQRVIAPRLLGLAPDEAAITAAMPKACGVVRELSRLLGSKDYFAGDVLSLADLAAGPHLDFLALTPEWEAMTADAPNILLWLNRMRARESFKATTWERVDAMAKAA